MRNERGYTLAEMLVVLAVFAVVMTLTTFTFNRIVSKSGHLMKSEQTEIEGMIGLELMRIDLENAGFGLPTSYQSTGWAGFGEAEGGSDAEAYNEATGSGAPRAILVGGGKGMNGSDYLVLKGTALGMSRTTRKWSYLTYTSSMKPLLKASTSDSDLTLEEKDGAGDWVIVLKDTVSAAGVGKQLAMDKSDFQVQFNTSMPKAFLPQRPEERCVVYGISPKTTIPERPFNRADYVIEIPKGKDLPARCASGTGRLYKKVLNPGSSDFTVYPLLDCVGDMQVVVGLDKEGNGIDFHTDDLRDPLEYDAQTIREQVKDVRVYILAHEGGRDSAYRYPVTDADKAVVVGDDNLSRVWKSSDMDSTFGVGWRNYRWKVFRIIVQPKNLQ